MIDATNHYRALLVAGFCLSLLSGCIGREPTDESLPLFSETSLQVGDKITHINGKPVTKDDLVEFALWTEGDESVLLTVERADGRIVQFKLVGTPVPRKTTDIDGPK